MENARVMISHAAGQGRRELSSAHFLRHPAKGVTGFGLVSLATVLSGCYSEAQGRVQKRKSWQFRQAEAKHQTKRTRQADSYRT